MDDTPVLPSACPLLRNIYHCQIEHLEQTVIRRKDRLCLCYLAELAIEALNGISGVDKPAYFLWVLEVCAKIRPVVTP